MERHMWRLVDAVEPWLAEGGVAVTAGGVTLELVDGTTASYRGTEEAVARQLAAAHVRVEWLLTACCPAYVGPSDVRRALTKAGIVAAFC
jgi:hypothetical protein